MRLRPKRPSAALRPIALAGLFALSPATLHAFNAPTEPRERGLAAVRGMTIGPIENGYHPDVGYGSPAYGRALDECRRAGAEWISITPFGRVGSLEGRGVDPTFEVPYEENKRAVRRAIEMAHERQLKVLLVPHLWTESHEWRALIDPKTDAAWERWAKSYGRFVKGWAAVAAETGAEMFSVGVELRSWVTSGRAPSFVSLVHEVRTLYRGLVTYSANWDDVDDTIVLGELDVIGVNAFFPLADKEGASFAELEKGGERVRERVKKVADAWRKPVLFTEIGYTTRPDPAYRPWEWPDGMKNVRVDEAAQALAYKALLKPLLDEPRFFGFFVWRVYADPEDVSQEPEWGFSPRGKRAELVVRDAFRATWAADGDGRWGTALRARTPGIY